MTEYNQNCNAQLIGLHENLHFQQRFSLTNNFIWPLALFLKSIFISNFESASFIFMVLPINFNNQNGSGKVTFQSTQAIFIRRDHTGRFESAILCILSDMYTLSKAYLTLF